jgi:hypothetical protein
MYDASQIGLMDATLVRISAAGQGTSKWRLRQPGKHSTVTLAVAMTFNPQPRLVYQFHLRRMFEMFGRGLGNVKRLRDSLNQIEDHKTQARRSKPVIFSLTIIITRTIMNGLSSR